MQERGCVVFLAKYQIIIEMNQVTLQGIGLTVLCCFQASRPFLVISVFATKDHIEQHLITIKLRANR